MDSFIGQTKLVAHSKELIGVKEGKKLDISHRQLYSYITRKIFCDMKCNICFDMIHTGFILTESTDYNRLDQKEKYYI